jgi:hypothetical protein
MEQEGLRWLRECYRDQVGHLETSLDKPGLFETLATQRVDLILMDNLHDTYNRQCHYRPRAGERPYSLPFSLSRCENKSDLSQLYEYGPALTAEDSAANWSRIIRFVQQRQPQAKIIFFCAHACTSREAPERFRLMLEFHAVFKPLAAELAIDLVPPFDLPTALTRMPEDWTHFDMSVYRAMAGYIFLKMASGGAV